MTQNTFFHCPVSAGYRVTPGPGEDLIISLYIVSSKEVLKVRSILLLFCAVWYGLDVCSLWQSFLFEQVAQIAMILINIIYIMIYSRWHSSHKHQHLLFCCRLVEWMVWLLFDSGVTLFRVLKQCWAAADIELISLYLHNFAQVICAWNDHCSNLIFSGLLMV